MSVGISLESDPFLMSRFFISQIASILTISLKQNILFLLKRLRIVTILGWFSNLVIIDSIFLVSEEEVGRTFSLIPRFFTILTKDSLNILANSPSSSIIFVLLTQVMLFLDFNLLLKICFTIFLNFLESVKLLTAIFSQQSFLGFCNKYTQIFLFFCICTSIHLFYNYIIL